MSTTTNTLPSTSLFYQEGASDKVYHASVEAVRHGYYVVNFSYGRRGSTLQGGTKTQSPVTLDQAIKIYDKLILSKTAKGYKPSEDGGNTYKLLGNEGRDTGVRCQLLNAIGEEEAERLIRDPGYCAQQKFDGRRLLVRKRGDEITGINRRGLVIPIPDPVRHAVADIQGDVLLDGEAVGETYHVFDLLEYKGEDIRSRSCRYRWTLALAMIPLPCPALSVVETAFASGEKSAMLADLRETNAEGIVFKELDAPYSAGRPNSGGAQLKFKFVETASFVVSWVNDKRSVALELYDGNKSIPVGNVSVPQNHEVPAAGEVVCCQYLYSFPGGSIYQPVYRGKRDDIPASECTIDQLKIKYSDEIEIV